MPILQKLHLPPELSETVSRSQEDQDTSAHGRGSQSRKPISLSTTASTSDPDSSQPGVVSGGPKVRLGGGMHGVGGDRSHGIRTDSEVAMTTTFHGQSTRGSSSASSRLKTARGKLSSHNIDF